MKLFVCMCHFQSNASGLLRYAALPKSGTPTKTTAANTKTVDLKSFIGKAVSAEETTPSSAVTTPITAVTATPTTAESAQTSTVVAKVGLVHVL